MKIDFDKITYGDGHGNLIKLTLSAEMRMVTIYLKEIVYSILMKIPVLYITVW